MSEMKVCFTGWKMVCVTESNVVPWRNRICIIENTAWYLDWYPSAQFQES